MKCKVVHSYSTGDFLDIEKVISLAVQDVWNTYFTMGNVQPPPSEVLVAWESLAGRHDSNAMGFRPFKCGYKVY